MAKLLYLSRPSKRVSNVVRAWWAIRSQKRRRERAGPTAPVPVIIGGDCEWGGTEPGWADTSIAWRIDYLGFPVASVEVWFRTSGTALQRIATVPSSAEWFYHSKVVNVEDDVFYRLCYRNGELVGPLSEEFRMVIRL